MTFSFVQYLLTSEVLSTQKCVQLKFYESYESTVFGANNHLLATPPYPPFLIFCPCVMKPGSVHAGLPFLS